MSIKYLNITVTNKKATFLTRQGDIVCGNSDYRARFTFDSEWDGHDAKVARFIWGGHFTDVEFSGTEVDVPVISGATEVKVGVYIAGDGPHTTTAAVIPCTPSILCEGGTVNTGTPSPGGGGSVEVVQTTGSSTTAVMSQRAVTEGLANKLDLRINTDKEYPQIYQVSANSSTQSLRILQSTWRNDESALIGYSAVQRDQYGCVQIATPRKDIDGANKKYVDAATGLYRHDLVFKGGLDYDSTTGVVRCTTYNSESTPGDYSNNYAVDSSAHAASGIITTDGTTYTVIGVAAGASGNPYDIYYAKPDGTVGIFHFWDGSGEVTDTVTKIK